MNKRLHIIIAIMTFVGSVAIATQAQTNRHFELRATIPFEFNVGSQMMSAGEYRLRTISTDSSTVVLKVESEDGKHSAVFSARAVEGAPQTAAKLMFHRYGSEYFFAAAWLNDAKEGLQTEVSRHERALQKELAAANRKVETVVVAVR